MVSDLTNRIEREAAALGLSLALVRTRKHRTYRVTDHAGRSRTLVMAVSPKGSGYRELRNKRAELRRIARDLGGDAGENRSAAYLNPTTPTN
jgi:hypothetical protein